MVGDFNQMVYECSTVNQLPKYSQSSFSTSDCLLRTRLDANGSVVLMKQTLDMLLDIYVERQ